MHAWVGAALLMILFAGNSCASGSKRPALVHFPDPDGVARSRDADDKIISEIKQNDYLCIDKEGTRKNCEYAVVRTDVLFKLIQERDACLGQ